MEIKTLKSGTCASIIPEQSSMRFKPGQVIRVFKEIDEDTAKILIEAKLAELVPVSAISQESLSNAVSRELADDDDIEEIIEDDIDEEADKADAIKRASEAMALKKGKRRNENKSNLKVK